MGWKVFLDACRTNFGTHGIFAIFTDAWSTIPCMNFETANVTRSRIKIEVCFIARTEIVNEMQLSNLQSIFYNVLLKKVLGFLCLTLV